MTDSVPPTTPELEATWSWLADVNSAPMGLLITLFLFLAVIMGIVFNFLMAKTAFMYRKKPKYKCTAHLLVTLGVIDLLYTLTQGVQVINYFLRGKAVTESCALPATLGLFLVLAEQLLYCWIIMERINSVFRPIQHHVDCPGRKTWLDLLMILTTSVVVSILVSYIAGTEFCPYRGRCWIKRSVTHHTLITIIISVTGLLPLLLTVLLLIGVLCLATAHSNTRALATLGSMTLVYLLSSYNEISILILVDRATTRRYFLALDSIVTLLSRCLSPVIYSYALKDYTLFCLSYVDDILFKPVMKGAAIVAAGIRTTFRRAKRTTLTISVPEFSLVSQSSVS